MRMLQPTTREDLEVFEVVEDSSSSLSLLWKFGLRSGVLGEKGGIVDEGRVDCGVTGLVISGLLSIYEMGV